MADYMNKEVFLHSMGLTGDETKYGNRDAEHQHRSYSTYMSYEIIDSVEDSIVEEELAPVRHGRWVADGYTKWQCNQCHCPSPMYGYPKADYVRTDYCPNCGADMRGTDNG